MHQEESLETRDIKLINGLMVQVFFEKTQMNGLLQQKIPEIDSNNDPEIKIVAVVNMVGQKQDILSILESRVSSWVKIKRVLPLVMLFKSKLLSNISEGKTCLNSESNGLIDVQMMEEDKKLIIRMVQMRSFRTEIKTIRSNEKINTLKEKALFTGWIHLLLKMGLSELEEG